MKLCLNNLFSYFKRLKIGKQSMISSSEKFPWNSSIHFIFIIRTCKFFLDHCSQCWLHISVTWDTLKNSNSSILRRLFESVCLGRGAEASIFFLSSSYFKCDEELWNDYEFRGEKGSWDSLVVVVVLKPVQEIKNTWSPMPHPIDSDNIGLRIYCGTSVFSKSSPVDSDI